MNISKENSFAGVKDIIRHGKILGAPKKKPEFTSEITSYELGIILQLDINTCMLVASLDEQGGPDFCVGNDAFVFRKLSDIPDAEPIVINRIEDNFVTTSGEVGVQCKFPAEGGFVPLGAKLQNGDPHPASGTGFLFSTGKTYLKDKTGPHPNFNFTMDIINLAWNGSELKITKRESYTEICGLPVGGNFLSQALPFGGGFLIPLTTSKITAVVKMSFKEGFWKPETAGEPFGTVDTNTNRECEPSILKFKDTYYVHTRSLSQKGYLYASKNAFQYELVLEKSLHYCPKTINKGLDGSFYLSTNPDNGFIRNPLSIYPFNGKEFEDGIELHNENGILNSEHDPDSIPFVDHPVGCNVFLEGKWRHFVCYRVCDLKERTLYSFQEEVKWRLFKGKPPIPKRESSGIYIAELVYENVSYYPYYF